MPIVLEALQRIYRSINRSPLTDEEFRLCPRTGLSELKWIYQIAKEALDRIDETGSAIPVEK